MLRHAAKTAWREAVKPSITIPLFTSADGRVKKVKQAISNQAADDSGLVPPSLITVIGAPRSPALSRFAGSVFSLSAPPRQGRAGPGWARLGRQGPRSQLMRTGPVGNESEMKQGSGGEHSVAWRCLALPVPA